MSVESITTIPPYRPMELISGGSDPSGEGGPSEPANAPVVQEQSSGVIQFTKDQVSGKMMMRVVDPESGDVVRQIPPEDMVAISRMLGLLFDKVA